MRGLDQPTRESYGNRTYRYRILDSLHPSADTAVGKTASTVCRVANDACSPKEPIYTNVLVYKNSLVRSTGLSAVGNRVFPVAAAAVRRVLHVETL